MRTHLITLALSLAESPAEPADGLKKRIEAALQAHGEPLRWAVIAIDPDQRLAHIEAVVTVV